MGLMISMMEAGPTVDSERHSQAWVSEHKIERYVSTGCKPWCFAMITQSFTTESLIHGSETNAGGVDKACKSNDGPKADLRRQDG